MKIRTKYRPELICSKDEIRPVIQDCELREIKGKPVLCATDGRRLVVIPVEEADPKEYGRVPRKALTFARSNRKEKRQEVVSIGLNGKVEFENGWSMPRQQELNYPNVETVIPEKVDRTVCISAKYLYELAQAMGVDQVQLHIKSPIDAILVTAHNEQAFSVLMPIRQS